MKIKWDRQNKEREGNWDAEGWGWGGTAGEGFSKLEDLENKKLDPASLQAMVRFLTST